ncbi:DUF4339 domain-containing protein [Shewanella sp. HL-SH2]|uniref:DUF4339 domain-containing protein n=1 Tax=Shewanella sp. HL-SH2 TaxID=3436238 RepID=UPI003EB88DAB
MNTWFFSKKGDVTGPLTTTEAIAFVKNDANCYGWNPHFTQWKPVGMITEFDEYVSAITPPAQVPQSLVDDFITKKNKLELDIVSMDDNIKFTKTYLYELEQEINIYKRLTNNLSDDMKGNITPYAQNYNNFNRIFDELVAALAIAKSEINEVVLEFDQRVAQRKAETLASLSISDKIVADSQSDVVDVITQPLNATTSLDPVAQSPKKSGVTNMLKSVFKGDSKKLNPLAEISIKTTDTPLVKSAITDDNSEAKDEVVKDEKQAAPHYWNMLNAPRTIY